MRKELEVQKRGKYGKPIVIKEVDVPEESELVLRNNRRIGKKRLQERQALHTKYQQRWASIYHIPKDLEKAKDVRKKAEKELEKHVARIEEKAASRAVVTYVAPTTVIKQTSSQRFKDEASVYLAVSFCVIFFALALFPALRSRVVAEINGSVVPHMHETVWNMTDIFADKLPLTSTIIKIMYNVVGFWPTVGLGVILLYQVRDFLHVVNVAVGALSRQVVAILAYLRRPKK